MDNIDKKIAELRMHQRLSKENKSNKENDIKEEKSRAIDLKDVINQIISGAVKINGSTFVFRKKSYLKERLEIPIPIKYFTEQTNTETNIALMNDLHGVSFTGTYIDSAPKKQKFSEFKAGMVKSFKEMKIFAEWIEEGSFGESADEVSYATYKTPTARGDVYNFLFYRQYNKTMLIGNYNCFYKEIDVWESLIKASVLLMKVK